MHKGLQQRGMPCSQILESKNVQAILFGRFFRSTAQIYMFGDAGPLAWGFKGDYFPALLRASFTASMIPLEL